MYVYIWLNILFGLHNKFVYPYILLYNYCCNSTGKIGRIGRHLAEKLDVEVKMCFGPMRPISPVEFQLISMLSHRTTVNFACCPRARSTDQYRYEYNLLVYEF